MNAKLIDFGLGNIYAKSGRLETPCGSPSFAAPEVSAQLRLGHHW